MFQRSRRHEAEFEFEHLAVTPEQAEEYNLESAPQKENDNRGEYMPETYQAEALDPDVLAGIVRTRLRELIGEENVSEAGAATEIEQAELLADIEKLSHNGKVTMKLSQAQGEPILVSSRWRETEKPQDKK